MTEQQIDRDQLRAVAHHAEQANSAVYLAPRDLLTLLDALDQAEAELDYWMTRAYEAEGKLWKAEARIRAVKDVLAHHHYGGPEQEDAIRQALDGDA